MESQILCVFKSRSPEYAVPETPLLVPTSLNRFGLSEIINTLLGVDKIPFDFLIQDQILKTCLETWLLSSNVSRETTMELEYIQSILPPKLQSTIQHDDWISSVASNKELYVYGSYDQQARIIDSKGSLLYTLSGHSKPVKSVLFHQNYCITGGQDSKILVHNYKNDRVEFECNGNSSIESLVDLGDRFAAGDASGKIHVFDSSKTVEPRSKRAKLEKSVKKSIMELSEHSGIVSGLEYSNEKLVSCGFDHSLRFWDLNTASNISSINAQVSYTSLKIQDSLILSGHSDSTVRLWDSRSNKLVSKFNGHSNWVSSVSWGNVFNFASASFDGSVKVWDIRSQSYMFNCATKQNKYLTLDWSLDSIVAGGQGGGLKFFKSTNAKYAAVIRKQDDSINDYKHLLHLHKLEITCLKVDLEKSESEFEQCKALMKQVIDKSIVTLKELCNDYNDLLKIINQKNQKSKNTNIKREKKVLMQRKCAQKPSDQIYTIPEEPDRSQESQIVFDEITLPSPPKSVHDEIIDANSRVRTRIDVSYKLPNLKSKLRKGWFVFLNFRG